MDLIERIFQKMVVFILRVMIGMLFSPLMQLEIIIYGLFKEMCEALTFLLDNIYIRFGSNYIDKL